MNYENGKIYMIRPVPDHDDDEEEEEKELSYPN